MHQHRFCVAPLVGYSHKHFRAMCRILSKNAMLYSEMSTANSLLFGNSEKLLSKTCNEHPSSFQIAGNDPDQMSKAAQLVENAGYDEININFGCPAKTVQKGQFGACQLRDADNSAEIVYRINKTVNLPITAKIRLGLVGEDIDCVQFVRQLVEAGISAVIVHARKADLSGMSTRQNLQVPPLEYEKAQKIKEQFPNLPVIINGGIQSLQQAKTWLDVFDGVMLGRAILSNLAMLIDVDKTMFSDKSNTVNFEKSMLEILDYCKRELAQDIKSNSKLLSTLCLIIKGTPNARSFRRYLCESKRSKEEITSCIEKYCFSLAN